MVYLYVSPNVSDAERRRLIADMLRRYPGQEIFVDLSTLAAPVRLKDRHAAERWVARP